MKATFANVTGSLNQAKPMIATSDSGVTALLEQTLPEAARLFGTELGREIAEVEIRLQSGLVARRAR